MRSLLLSACLGLLWLASPASLSRATAADAAKPVFMTIEVPANAQVWFDNTTTQQNGSVRYFESPPIQTGKTFIYHLRARWMENGQPVQRAQDVRVRAGEQVVVQFPANGEQPLVTRREGAPARMAFYPPSPPAPAQNYAPENYVPSAPSTSEQTIYYPRYEVSGTGG